eukprot:TRINITY_DN27791_c2_g1_i1.p3 TRINITY_DN27791_c2_g1~~TRINITY_DN27791_c2_g1_i1.p3  ORF type:complete len:130 (-),score=11.23 TRINITY_DN27791_c2_g1_i1:96-485(-)
MQVCVQKSCYWKNLEKQTTKLPQKSIENLLKTKNQQQISVVWLCMWICPPESIVSQSRTTISKEASGQLSHDLNFLDIEQQLQQGKQQQYYVRLNNYPLFQSNDQHSKQTSYCLNNTAYFIESFACLDF